LDFLLPSGALYVPGAERIIERLSRLNCYAATNAIPVISTMDAHTEDDPEFSMYPHHCVAGTLGQRKPASALLEKRVVLPSAASYVDFAGVEQVLLEKQKLDCFTNVNLVPLLERLNADRYVVYGVVTEICVKFAAWGLLGCGKPVELLRDAVSSLSKAAEANT